MLGFVEMGLKLERKCLLFPAWSGWGGLPRGTLVFVYRMKKWEKKIKILFQPTPYFNERHEIYGRILCHYFICFSHFSFLRSASIMLCLLLSTPHNAPLSAIEVRSVVNPPLGASSHPQQYTLLISVEKNRINSKYKQQPATVFLIYGLCNTLSQPVPLSFNPNPVRPSSQMTPRFSSVNL